MHSGPLARPLSGTMMTKLETKNLTPVEYIELKNAISKLDDDATVSPDFESPRLQ